MEKSMKTTKGLEQEIARLYKLGKTPAPYCSTSVTEIMMNLYLTNKYKFKDPTQKDIRKDYRAYGMVSRRLKQQTPVPQLYTWQLCLYYDEKERLVRTNRDEYYSAFYWKLTDMIRLNPGKKIACSFDIEFYTNEVATLGHTETILYDPALNILEHVDSNNLPKHCARRDPEYFQCCEVTNAILEDVAKALPQCPLYINNTTIYHGYEWGIQSIEAASNKHTESEKDGYCLMWSNLFADLALSFPEYSVRQIIDVMLKKAKSAQTKVDCMNDYLLYVIRGYVTDISNTLGVNFEDEASKHEACVQLVRAF